MDPLGTGIRTRNRRDPPGPRRSAFGAPSRAGRWGGTIAPQVLLAQGASASSPGAGVFVSPPPLPLQQIPNVAASRLPAAACLVPPRGRKRSRPPAPRGPRRRQVQAPQGFLFFGAVSSLLRRKPLRCNRFRFFQPRRSPTYPLIPHPSDSRANTKGPPPGSCFPRGRALCDTRAVEAQALPVPDLTSSTESYQVGRASSTPRIRPSQGLLATGHDSRYGIHPSKGASRPWHPIPITCTLPRPDC